MNFLGLGLCLDRALWQEVFMGDVINLNRFRKKKAREEKARRAETNRRLHGRTKAERARDDAVKKRIEDKLDGAYLVREDVRLEDIPAAEAFESLEAAAEAAISLEELGARSSSARGAEERGPGTSNREGEQSKD